jgi:hypothetical protein
MRRKFLELLSGRAGRIFNGGLDFKNYTGSERFGKTNHCPANVRPQSQK